MGKTLFIGDSHLKRMEHYIRSSGNSNESMFFHHKGGAKLNHVKEYIRGCLCSLSQFDRIVIHAGSCDIYNKRGERLSCPSQMIKHFEELVVWLKGLTGQSTRIILCGLLFKGKPWQNGMMEECRRRGVLLNNNNMIEHNRISMRINKRLAILFGYDFVCYDGLLEMARTNAKEVYSRDLVHLNAKGYKVLAKNISICVGQDF